MKDEPIPTETTVVQLMGVHQDAKARIWKEVHLFKERRMVHVYDIRWEVAEGDGSLETNERDAKLLWKVESSLKGIVCLSFWLEQMVEVNQGNFHNCI